MAIRTSISDVKNVMETSLTDAQITAFITTANAMVYAYLDGKGLSDTLLTHIETYVAAHLVTLRDRRSASESADGVSFAYEGDIGQGLDSSTYGQTAQTLDTTGTLGSLGADDRIPWIARAGSERTNIDYDDDLPSRSQLRGEQED